MWVKMLTQVMVFGGEMFNIINKLEGFYSIARVSSSTHAPPTKIDLPSEFMLSTYFPLFFLHKTFSCSQKERKIHSINSWYTAAARRRKERNIQFREIKQQSPIEQAATSCGGKTQCAVFLFGKMWEKTLEDGKICEKCRKVGENFVN